MSQHDMVIDDAGGAAFLADLNASIKALVSTSKGNSRPATAYAGQLWIDDNTPSSTVWTLYLFDGTDDIALGTFNTTSNTFTAANAPSGVPTGTIMLFAGASAPATWALCDGGESSRTGEAALFDICGTTYGGGNGSTTFNRPDLRGRFAVGRDNMGGTPANRTTSANGVDGVTLGAGGGSQSSNAPPNHAHPYVRAHIDDSGSFHVDNYAYLQKVSLGTPDSAGVRLVGENTNAAGGGATVPNLPPALVLNYIIKL